MALRAILRPETPSGGGNPLARPTGALGSTPKVVQHQEHPRNRLTYLLTRRPGKKVPEAPAKSADSAGLHILAQRGRAV